MEEEEVEQEEEASGGVTTPHRTTGAMNSEALTEPPWNLRNLEAL